MPVAEESGPAPDATAHSDTIEATPTQPRAYFPYTIRSGDTLESIAAIFGVQVSDLTRSNRHISNDNLTAGDTIKIPNTFAARERDFEAQIERLSIEKQEAEQRSDQARNALTALRSQIEAITAVNDQSQRDLHSLPWWRAATWGAAALAVLMFGIALLAAVEWWLLRWRYRAVVGMNDSLRRLDHKYRLLMAKAELRLQELYGRRRRGLDDAQERPRIPEEKEIERLDQALKEILEIHLERLGPPGDRARRARWRELIGGSGAPVEARSLRR